MTKPFLTKPSGYKKWLSMLAVMACVFSSAMLVKTPASIAQSVPEALNNFELTTDAVQQLGDAVTAAQEASAALTQTSQALSQLQNFSNAQNLLQEVNAVNAAMDSLDINNLPAIEEIRALQENLQNLEDNIQNSINSAIDNTITNAQAQALAAIENLTQNIQLPAAVSDLETALTTLDDLDIDIGNLNLDIDLGDLSDLGIDLDNLDIDLGDLSDLGIDLDDLDIDLGDLSDLGIDLDDLDIDLGDLSDLGIDLDNLNIDLADLSDLGIDLDDLDIDLGDLSDLSIDLDDLDIDLGDLSDLGIDLDDLDIDLGDLSALGVDISDLGINLGDLDIPGLDVSIPVDFPFSIFSSPGSALSTTPSHIADTKKGIKDNFIAAFMLMTEQISAIANHQTFSIGTFLDAKQQLEAQRTHQALKARAVKDYHPSDQMCRIGSYMRSIAKAEHKAESDTRMMGDILLSHMTGERASATMEGDISYIGARLQKFRTTYCDPNDNNNGLATMCDHDQKKSTPETGAIDPLRMNKDIDFASTMDARKTLGIDFSDLTVSPDEEDVIALAANLYWPTALEWPEEIGMQKRATTMPQARRLIALNAVAQNSFTNLAGLKAQSLGPSGASQPGWAFMKSFIREFGLSDDEINQWLGENPSYWAQMDVLTKKIAQHPNFYTNLYDKPTNVDRIGVSLQAIKLMQMRDHYDSSLRAELIKSAMVETELESEFNKVKVDLMTQ